MLIPQVALNPFSPLSICELLKTYIRQSADGQTAQKSFRPTLGERRESWSLICLPSLRKRWTACGAELGLEAPIQQEQEIRRSLSAGKGTMFR